MKPTALVCYLLLLVTTLPAQRADLEVRSLTTEDGLPQGFVTGIVQDKKGFMWFGTLDGLARYDGKDFRIFKHDETDSTSLLSNVIRNLSLDNGNNLWVQHENGNTDILNTVNEKIIHLPREILLNISYSGFTPYKFDVQGNAYRIYYHRKRLENRMTCIRANSLEETIVPFFDSTKLVDEAIDKNGIVWGLSVKELYKLKSDGVPLKVNRLPDSLTSQIRAMYKDWSTLLYFNAAKNELVLPAPSAMWFYNIYLNAWRKLQYPASIVPANTKRVFANKTGKLFLSADDKIYSLNAKDSFELMWTNDSRIPTIISASIDNSNLLWVSTNTFGLRIIDLSRPSFRSSPIINNFFYDVIPNLYGLHVNPFKPYVNDNSDNDGRSTYDTNGNYWFINYWYGQLNQYSILSNSLIKIKQDGVAVINLTEQRKNWKINNFVFNNKNECWAITARDRHLLKINTETGNIIEDIIVDANFSIANYLVSLGDELCIVISDGLIIYNTQSRKELTFREKTPLLRTADLLMAVEDPLQKQVLWICSRNSGLIRFNITTGAARSFNMHDGLPNNTVYAVLADKKGYLWCSSNKGLFRFNTRDYSVLSFTEKDGLQGNEFNRYQFMQLPDGRMIFGGTQGWTIFHPDSVRVDDYQPNIELTDIAINNESIFKNPHWSEQFSSTDTFHLAYHQNFLTFRFAALQYNNPEKLQYRYRLSGIDKNWVTTGNQNSANFTNLSPGEYELQLNATNTSGTWSSHIKSISFAISSPWWKTWWAYLAYFLIAGTLTISFFRLKLNQAKARQTATLKQKEAEQLKAIDELKSRFYSNITHEFRTPLSLIISPAELLQQNSQTPEFVRNKLSVIQRNASQLLRLINQLLDMSKIESGSMNLSYNRGHLPLFIEDCVSVFKTAAIARNIDLQFEASGINNEALFDADKLEKIVYNLLSNAVKFTPNDGKITVTLDLQPVDKTIATTLQVRDSGVGIDGDSLHKIFDRFYQVDNSATRRHEGTGIGLALVKELANLMNGTVTAESQQGYGTVFTLALPLQPATTENVPYWLPATNPTEEGLPVAAHFQPLTSEELPLLLVVEDNEELRSFVSGMLFNDYRVLTAANGKEGVQLAQQELPDLVISDIMMPEMDGFTLSACIKTNPATEHIAVILLSARAAHESVIEGLQSGADDYITKPFHFDELQLRIRNILQRSEKLRNHYQAQLSNPDADIKTADPDHPFITGLYGVIETYLDDTNFSVETLAIKSAMSSRTLNRKLSCIIGISANELIKRYRLNRSIEFLKAGLNVSEAAYNVGFETHSHFSTSFKTFFGVTPSEYLAARQKN